MPAACSVGQHVTFGDGNPWARRRRDSRITTPGVTMAAQKRSTSSRTGGTRRPPQPVEPPPAVPVLTPRTSKVPAQDSEYLTTAQGQRLSHTDDSLKAGARGPTLMDDFHLREKIMHFDHERIPERVVHARGAGAHGVFTANGAAGKVTRAAVLAEKGL